MLKLLDLVDESFNLLSPLAVGCFLVASVYLCSATYGALTVMQVFGFHEGFEFLETRNPLQLSVMLPTIPVLLISSRFIDWQEPVLNYLHKKLEMQSTDLVPRPNSNSTLRQICGGLLLPTIAVLLGEVLCFKVKAKYERCLYGGLLYFGLKSVSKIYYELKKETRKKDRDVVNYKV